MRTAGARLLLRAGYILFMGLALTCLEALTLTLSLVFGGGC